MCGTEATAMQSSGGPSIFLIKEHMKIKVNFYDRRGHARIPLPLAASSNAKIDQIFPSVFEKEANKLRVSNSVAYLENLSRRGQNAKN